MANIVGPTYVYDKHYYALPENPKYGLRKK